MISNSWLIVVGDVVQDINMDKIDRSAKTPQTMRSHIRNQLKSNLNTHRTGPEDKYPYRQWLNGDDYEVLAEDYGVSASSLKEAIRKKARKLGIQVITWTTNKGRSVGIKAIGIVTGGK